MKYKMSALQRFRRRNKDEERLKPTEDIGSDELIFENVQRLISQIGVYPIAEHEIIDCPLSPGSYEADEESPYTPDIQQAQVKLYTDLVYSQTAREEFIKYVLEYKKPELDLEDRNALIKEGQAEQATITLETLIGKKGVELYKKALLEEQNSREFRDATFQASISYVHGNKWQQRLVLPIGGPSASGKSFARPALIRAADKKMPKSDEIGSNPVIAIDGGIVREVSQMRKLILQIAYQQGYTGIRDLHAKSESLDSVKRRMLDAAKADPQLSLVIPETFSNPTKWSLVTRNTMIRNLKKIPESKLIFSRVTSACNASYHVDSDTSANEASFSETIAHNGRKRAWREDFEDQRTEDSEDEIAEDFDDESTETSEYEIAEDLEGESSEDFETFVDFDDEAFTELDLNKKFSGESKKYSAGFLKKNFKAGVNGSFLAEREAKKLGVPDDEILHVIYGLALYKETEPGNNDWRPTNKSEAGVISFPKRAYSEWKLIPKSQRPPIQEFRGTGEPVEIKTLAQVKAEGTTSKQEKVLRHIIDKLYIYSKTEKKFTIMEFKKNLESKFTEIFKRRRNVSALVERINDHGLNEEEKQIPLYMVMHLTSDAISVQEKIKACYEIGFAVRNYKIGEHNKYLVLIKLQHIAFKLAEGNRDNLNLFKQYFGPDSEHYDYMEEKIRTHKITGKILTSFSTDSRSKEESIITTKQIEDALKETGEQEEVYEPVAIYEQEETDEETDELGAAYKKEPRKRYIPEGDIYDAHEPVIEELKKSLKAKKGTGDMDEKRPTPSTHKPRFKSRTIQNDDSDDEDFDLPIFENPKDRNSQLRREEQGVVDTDDEDSNDDSTFRRSDSQERIRPQNSWKDTRRTQAIERWRQHHLLSSNSTRLYSHYTGHGTPTSYRPLKQANLEREIAELKSTVRRLRIKSTENSLSFNNILREFKTQFSDTNSEGIKEIIQKMSNIQIRRDMDDNHKFTAISKIMHDIVTKNVALSKTRRVDSQWLKNKKLGFFGKGRDPKVQKLYDIMARDNFSLTDKKTRREILNIMKGEERDSDSRPSSPGSSIG